MFWQILQYLFCTRGNTGEWFALPMIHISSLQWDKNKKSDFTEESQNSGKET